MVGMVVIDEMAVQVLLVGGEVEQAMAAQVEDDELFARFALGQFGHGGDGVGCFGAGTIPSDRANKTAFWTLESVARNAPR